MTSQGFPDHPFWNYSLRLYAGPGVADASIFLQDEFGLDVNLLLFCIWSGAEGPGGLESEEIAQAMARGHQWQNEVVECLRDVRRKLKRAPFGASAELARLLRPQVQSVELAAEHVEQIFLGRMVPLARGSRGLDQAVTNVRGYLAAAGVDAAGAVEEPILNVLGPAFPEAARSDIQRTWRGGSN